MPTFAEIVYPLLATAQRLTVRRDYRAEIQRQRQFHAQSLADQQSLSHLLAVRYVNLMADAVPIFRQRLIESGLQLPLGTDEESWRRLPLLRKADYQQGEFQQWTNPHIPPSSISWSYTSGSSGEPFRFSESAESRTGECVSWELSLLETGWRLGQRAASIKVSAPPVRGLRRIVKGMLGTLPITFSAVNYRYEDTPRIVEELNRGKVQLLRSYPTVLLLLSEEMLRRGLRCNIPRIMVFGEGLSHSRAAVIAEAFGARIYRDYGGSEAMHIGVECPHCGEYHLDLSRYKVELLNGDQPCREGETGEIVVTSFRNETFPLVRYRMGDLGVLSSPSEKSRCGRISMRLSQIAGRVIDVIRAPNGELLDAAFLVVVMEYAHEHILAYKFIQRSETLVEALYVPRHPRAHEHLASLEKQIVDRTHGAVKVRWTEVAAIPSEASGKRKILVPLKADWKTAVDQEQPLPSPLSDQPLN